MLRNHGSTSRRHDHELERNATQMAQAGELHSHPHHRNRIQIPIQKPHHQLRMPPRRSHRRHRHRTRRRQKYQNEISRNHHLNRRCSHIHRMRHPHPPKILETRHRNTRHRCARTGCVSLENTHGLRCRRTNYRLIQQFL